MTSHSPSWLLADGVHHLNHGSFGATPVAVLETQQRWRDAMEANPTVFIEEEYLRALWASRDAVATFVDADAKGLVFVENATTGVAAAVRSVDLAPGDRILVTDHEYNACRNIVDVAAMDSGAEVVVAPLRFPDADPDQVVESVLSHVDHRTRLVVVDHITSATAMVLAVDRIVSELEPDVPVVVDGAHAPGAIDLSVSGVGASFYAGNLHKWVCGPKGAAFLVTAERHRDRMRPGTISHGWNSDWGALTRYQRLFDWIGTRDPSAWLSVPAAIEFMGALVPDGWPGIRRRNRELALAARDVLCRRLGVDQPVPDVMLGPMAAIPLPDAPDDLAIRLRAKGFVVVVNRIGDLPVLRVSAQLYNSLGEYEALADAL